MQIPSPSKLPAKGGMMTLEELVSLDRYGHRDINELTEVQLVEYFTLLYRRLEDIKRFIKKVNGKLPMKVKQRRY